MEAVATLSLVACIFTIIDFSSRVVSETRDFLGSTADTFPRHELIDTLVQDNQDLKDEIVSMTARLQAPSKVELAVCKLAQRCAEESEKILQLLRPLRIASSSGKRSKREVLWKTAKSALVKDGQIETHQRKLERLELQLCTLQLQCIRQSGQSQLEGLAELGYLVKDRASVAIDLMKRNNSDLVDEIRGMRNDISNRLQALKQATQRLEAFASGVELRAEVDRALRALSFPQMGDRAQRIEQRESNTFDWIFNRSYTCSQCERAKLGDSSESDTEGYSYSESGDGEESYWESEEEERNVSEPDEEDQGYSEPGEEEQKSSKPDEAGKSSSKSEDGEESCPHVSRSSFASWMAGDESFFWVCGEPGSGKSVLIKTLRHHPRTAELVKRWSEARPHLMIEHYFWIAGHEPLQKSSIGMLRAILYQVIARFPGLLASDQTLRDLCITGSFATEPLLDLVVRIAESVSICLFVDGLDECEGDQKNHTALINDLGRLAASQNIKICLSSRPWQAFEKAYAHLPSKIMLQEMTEMDIFSFVISVLGRVDRQKYSERVCAKSILRRYHRLGLHEPLKGIEHAQFTVEEVAARNLINEITRKSEGSFLWTSLVMDTICARIEIGESPSQLKSHLNTLPERLGEYYEQSIYQRISETYRGSSLSEVAMVLKIAVTHPDAEFIRYWALRESAAGHGDMIRSPTFGQDAEFRKFSSKEWQTAQKTATKYLRACARGLLDVAPADSHWDAYVMFTHRTVYDFLKSDRGKALLHGSVPPHFEPEDFCDELRLLEAKHFAEFDGEKTYVRLKTQGRLLIDQGRKDRLQVWERTAVQAFERFSPDPRTFFLSQPYDTPNLVADFLDRGLFEFASYVVRLAPELAIRDDFTRRSCLMCLLFDDCSESSELVSLKKDVPLSLVETFFCCGTCPNQAAEDSDSMRAFVFLLNTALLDWEPTTSWSGRSIWHEYLIARRRRPSTQRTEGSPDDVDVQRVFDTVRIFLSFGADPDSDVCVAKGICGDRRFESLQDLCKDWPADHVHEWVAVSAVLEETLPTRFHPEVAILLQQCREQRTDITERRLRQLQTYETKYLFLEDAIALGRPRGEWRETADIVQWKGQAGLNTVMSILLETDMLRDTPAVMRLLKSRGTKTAAGDDNLLDTLLVELEEDHRREWPDEPFVAPFWSKYGPRSSRDKGIETGGDDDDPWATEDEGNESEPVEEGDVSDAAHSRHEEEGTAT